MLEPGALLAQIPVRLPDHRVVVPLGDTANRTFARADSHRNFYLLGAMGMSIPLALGLARGSRHRVLAVEGDGGLLMNLGTLLTLAHYPATNLSVLVLDNGAYASTGGQPTTVAGTTSVERLCRGAGLSAVRTIEQEAEVEEGLAWLGGPGPRVAVARVGSERACEPFVPLPPPVIARRFRHALSSVA